MYIQRASVGHRYGLLFEVRDESNSEDSVRCTLKNVHDWQIKSASMSNERT